MLPAPPHLLLKHQKLTLAQQVLDLCKATPCTQAQAGLQLGLTPHLTSKYISILRKEQTLVTDNTRLQQAIADYDAGHPLDHAAHRHHCTPAQLTHALHTRPQPKQHFQFR